MALQNLLQLGRDEANGGDAAVALLDQHAVKQIIQRFARFGQNGQQIGDGVVQDGMKGGDGVFALERPLARQHLIEQHTKAPNVGPLVQTVPQTRLGAQIGHRAHNGSRLGQV